LNNGTPLPPPPPTGASLSGNVFEDLDFSGTQDAGEFGLAHFVLTVYDANGVQVGNSFETAEGTETAPPDGSFSFTGLQAGVYSLVVTPDVNYGVVSDVVGSAGGNFDLNNRGTIFSINLVAGMQATGYQFGGIGGFGN
jgi:SdrD B-like domain